MEQRKVKFITIDVETDGLDPWHDKLVLVGYRLNGQGPVKHLWLDSPNDNVEHWQEFDRLANDPNVTKRGHNIKFDALFLLANRFRIIGPFDDTRVISYCENPFQNAGLKSLVRERLHREVVEFKMLTSETTSA